MSNFFDVNFECWEPRVLFDFISLLDPLWYSGRLKAVYP